MVWERGVCAEKQHECVMLYQHWRLPADFWRSTHATAKVASKTQSLDIESDLVGGRFSRCVLPKMRCIGLGCYDLEKT